MSGEQSVVFDRVADSYDATRGGMERGRRVAAVIAPLLPAGPVLEIGVGTGLIAAGLAELGRPPIGVDLSLPMLAAARKRIPGRLAVGDALRLPVGTGAVAGVCLVHVLHLVADIPTTLDEIARVLRPGGSMVTTAFAGPSSGDLPEEFDRLRDRVGGRPRTVDVPSVTRLAAEAGLTLSAHVAGPDDGTTPRAAAGLVETRSLSWMWAVDDEVWAQELPVALQRLRALPDQDRPRPAAGSTVLAFHHP